MLLQRQVLSQFMSMLFIEFSRFFNLRNSIVALLELVEATSGDYSPCEMQNNDSTTDWSDLRIEIVTTTGFLWVLRHPVLI